MTLWAKQIATVSPEPGKTYLDFLLKRKWRTSNALAKIQHPVDQARYVSYESNQGISLECRVGGGVPQITLDGTWAVCSCQESLQLHSQRCLCSHQMELALATPYLVCTT